MFKTLGAAKGILVGNKVDMEWARQVQNEDGERLAEELGLLAFFETSAQTATKVRETFHECARQFRKPLLSDNTTKPIPLPRRHPPIDSNFKIHLLTAVGNPSFSDVIFESDDWEKFLLLKALIKKGYPTPSEIWASILQLALCVNSFSNPFQIPAHKCILLSRFPALSEFMSDSAKTISLPSRFSTNAVKVVLRWIYASTWIAYQPASILTQVTEIAKFLKIYSLLPLCDPTNSAQRPIEQIGFQLICNASVFHDFQIHCGNKILYGHQIIIISRCPQFFKQVTETAILRDQIETFPFYELLLRYMYTDEVDFSMLSLDSLKEFFLFCGRPVDSFKDPKLSFLIQYELCYHVNWDTALDLFTWSSSGSFKPHHAYFESYLKTWLGYRVHIMRKSPKWKKLSSTQRSKIENLQIPGNWIENDSSKDLEREKCVIS